ncbi:hypothetical protein [Pseudomonas syringae]|uniref:hypothetical protein n=1 Tax=Pseudomonas syringae TaxID=317 RepID=UPI001F2371F3|nr:hypothetical protein [Pseudomonas syringae]MCF5371979.1 hypothetical protein [Pseudomonas syringae]
MTTVQKIRLADRGQDFTEWYVRDGIVIDCQPCQGKFWVGTRLEYPEGQLKKGSVVHMRAPASSKLTNLNYPVESIEQLDDTQAAIVEGYGRKWAEIKGIAPAQLGL